MQEIRKKKEVKFSFQIAWYTISEYLNSTKAFTKHKGPKICKDARFLVLLFLQQAGD